MRSPEHWKLERWQGPPRKKLRVPFIHHCVSEQAVYIVHDHLLERTIIIYVI